MVSVLYIACTLSCARTILVAAEPYLCRWYGTVSYLSDSTSLSGKWLLGLCKLQSDRRDFHPARLILVLYVLSMLKSGIMY